mgnify:CR=1 FL=1
MNEPPCKTGSQCVGGKCTQCVCEEPITMNPIIKEFADEAEEYVKSVVGKSRGWSDASIIEIRRNKFAELIIRECISAVEDTNDRHRRDYFAAKIREHFGIE